MSKNILNLLASLGIVVDEDVCPDCGGVHDKKITIDQWRENLIKEYTSKIETTQIALDLLKNKSTNELGLKLGGIEAGRVDDSDDIFFVMVYMNEEKTSFQIIGWNYTTDAWNEYMAVDEDTALAFANYAKKVLIQSSTPRATFHFGDTPVQ